MSTFGDNMTEAIKRRRKADESKTATPHANSFDRLKKALGFSKPEDDEEEYAAAPERVTGKS